MELQIVNIKGLDILPADVSASILLNALRDISGIRKLVIVNVSLRHAHLDNSKALNLASVSRDAFKLKCASWERSGIQVYANVFVKRFKSALLL